MYLRHQHDGAFWRSPVRPYSEIKVPAFLIGGMQDGYRDSIPAILEQAKVPVRALIGPWNHSWPNDADFGPRVEWRDQATRWWDYWLKGRDTGVLEDPKLADPDPSRAANIPADQQAFLKAYESREAEMIKFLQDKNLITLPRYLGHFYIRQLHDMKIKLLVELFTLSVMGQYADFCGWALARAPPLVVDSPQEQAKRHSPGRCVGLTQPADACDLSKG